jgi:hypothetical protein
MAGLAPAIHVFLARVTKDVDARLKAGHDDGMNLQMSLIGLLAVPIEGATTARIPKDIRCLITCPSAS